MSVIKVSDYAIGDSSINDLMTSTDDQRYGFHQSSLTEWNTTTIPEVAAGTRFENNGALYKVTTDTAITGSPADGKVFIYFDVSELGFVMTATPPTWADDKQGWYSGNDRYLPFYMTKATASYSDKRMLLVNSQGDRYSLENGANADVELFFASDASILWDESEDGFVVDKKFKNIQTSHGIKTTATPTTGYYSYLAAETFGDVWDDLSLYFTEEGTYMCNGIWGTDPIVVIRRLTTQITIKHESDPSSGSSSETFSNGDSTPLGSDMIIVF